MHKRSPTIWDGTCRAIPALSCSICRAPAVSWSPTGRAFAIEPLLTSQNVKFDARKFGWLGTANVEYTTCLAWHTAPVKTLQDLLSKELIVGGSGVDTTEVVWPKAANKLVGTKIRFVTGCAGSAEINLAMERGELEGNCGLGWIIVKLRKAEWLK